MVGGFRCDGVIFVIYFQQYFIPYVILEYAMEFPFSLSNLLSAKITKIQHNLLPEGFSGDRRSAW